MFNRNLEINEGRNNNIIVNDYCIDDLSSLKASIEFVLHRNVSNQPINIILGAETRFSDRHVDAINRIIAEYSLQYVYIIDGSPSMVSNHLIYCNVYDDYINKNQIFTNSILLINAPTKLNRQITAHFQAQSHQTELRVDLTALSKNLQHYKTFLSPETKIICMIKACGYGAGAVEVAKTLQQQGVDYLAVAVADEGVKLREEGIRCPIMVMNPERSAFHSLVEYQLEPEMYNFYLLEAFIKYLKLHELTAYPIHVKVDTGMHRLGFTFKNIDKLVELLKNEDAVKPVSVFSHFVGSDSPVFDDFSEVQKERFRILSDKIRKEINTNIIRHQCNTAGIERFHDVQYEMVRLGLGLYGINPIDNSTINTVTTLVTKVLYVDEVDASETVGYSRKGILNKNSKIAALPLGYADGLFRALGNRKGYCLVNGEKAPYVGNICMDICMVDVTGIECKEGDSVEIFGPNLSVSRLAEWVETIPYEIITTVSSRVKRVYIG
jgi:alanine racemase